jgi:tRNA pseudouridine55 synthase
MDKEYTATMRLGVETSTHDPEGEIVSEDDGWRELGEAQLNAALQGLLGPILQIPPVYSAKKVRGEASHRRVRRGEAVDLNPVEVHVYDLRVLGLELPSVQLGVRCSSGTYVRALARDLGRSLGVGGHLTALRRVGIGPFLVDSAVDFDSLADPALIEAELLPPAEALSHFPSLEVGPEDAGRILHGQSLSMAGSEIPERTPVRILLNGNLLAVAAREGEMLRPKKVFSHG